MLKWLEHKLYPQLENHDFANNDEMYLFLLLQVASVFALLMHVFLLAVFVLSQIWVMALVSLASILLDALLCFILVQRRAYLTARLLFTAEVILYTLILTVCMGTSNFGIIYLVLLLIVQMVLPSHSLHGAVRALLLVLIWASMVSIFFMQRHLTPLYQMSDILFCILAIGNISMGCIGTFTELTIGNQLKRMISDYSALQMLALESEANTDPLTGLYNRRYAEEVFQKLQDETDGPTYCIAMLDIDDFKNINDVYGHAAGDVVLREVASVMQMQLRKTDYLFRWGGEEFLLLLHDVKLQTAFLIIEKLRLALASKSVYVAPHVIHFTITAGLVEMDRNALQNSINKSDEMLYIGKRGGKNRVTF